MNDTASAKTRFSEFTLVVNYPTNNLTAWARVKAVIEACVQPRSSTSTRGHRTRMASPATGPDAERPSSTHSLDTKFGRALHSCPFHCLHSRLTGTTPKRGGFHYSKWPWAMLHQWSLAPDSFPADAARRRALPGARLPSSDRMQSLSKTDRASLEPHSTNSGPRGSKPLEFSSCPLRGKMLRVLRLVPFRGRRDR